MNYLLIDSDSVAFGAASTSIENDPERFERDEEEVIRKINDKINFILNDLSDLGVDIDCYKLFIGTKYNARNIIYPQYKANRTDSKPTLLEFALSYMENELNAFRVPFMEAEDLVHAAKIELEKDWENNVVVGYIDSDVPQFEGTYYDYYYGRKQEDRLKSVSQEQAVFNFWGKMCKGDRKDNIFFVKGYRGTNKLLKGVDNNFSALRKVYALYLDKLGRKGREKFILNYRLLRAITHNVPTPKDYTAIL